MCPQNCRIVPRIARIAQNCSIINGEIVYEGAKIKNVIIEKIEKDSLTLLINGLRRILKIGESTLVMEK